jgi:hypothetical protein
MMPHDGSLQMMDDFIPTGMNHSDFFIGCAFLTGAGRWRCTDIGTRVIVAMCMDTHPDDPSWYNGPPYAVAESVFDEEDQQGCTPLPLPGPGTAP